MNQWQQTKTYQCPKCRATYLHDKAYQHDSYSCPWRQPKPGVRGIAVPVPAPARVCQPPRLVDHPLGMVVVD